MLTHLLLQHQQKHQPRTMECCGCSKTLKTFSGVLIHLQSGNCASAITEEEIDGLARRCYQSRKYINDGCEGWIYKCPRCEIEFSKALGTLSACRRCSTLRLPSQRQRMLGPTRTVYYEQSAVKSKVITPFFLEENKYIFHYRRSRWRTAKKRRCSKSINIETGCFGYDYQYDRTGKRAHAFP